MRTQTAFEEKLNTFSHALGALLGVCGLVLLIIYNTRKTDWSLFSVLVYGASIIILFTASALYHWVRNEKKIGRAHV